MKSYILILTFNLLVVTIFTACENKKEPEKKGYISVYEKLEKENTLSYIIYGTPTYHKLKNDTTVETSFILRSDLLDYKYSKIPDSVKNKQLYKSTDTVYYSVKNDTLNITRIKLISGNCPLYLTKYKFKNEVLKVWIPQVEDVDTTEYQKSGELWFEGCDLANFVEITAKIALPEEKIPKKIFYYDKRLK